MEETSYPKEISDESADRYKIPLITAGGAIRSPMKVNTYVSKIDIDGTLLYQSGISSKECPFSKNIMNPSSPHFGFFTFPNLFGLVTAGSQVVYDCEGKNAAQRVDKGKAFLQKLYGDLSSR